MRALEIEYTGTGSDKQIAWAKSIYAKEINQIAEYRAAAERRVNDKEIPAAWLSIIDNILDDVRVVDTIKKFAAQPAAMTIDYKGFVVNGQCVSIYNQIKRVAAVSCKIEP